MGEEISMFLLDIIKNACLVPVNDQILVFKGGSDTKRSCKNFEVMILNHFIFKKIMEIKVDCCSETFLMIFLLFTLLFSIFF